MGDEQDTTALLLAWSAGEGAAAEKLMAAVYDDLRGIAGGLLKDRRQLTLQPTALVHEAFLRLIDQSRVRWSNRAHFLAIAAKVMRRIAVDFARRRQALRRGGGQGSLSLEGLELGTPDETHDTLALHEALNRLAHQDRTKASVVELRFFGGLTVRETAEVLKCSKATVERHWEMARAWLYRELS